MHVLVVAKNAATAEGLVAALRAARCVVHLASGADEVVRCVRELPLSAVLVVSMKGPDAERFREHILRAHPACRVVFLSRTASPSGDGSAESGGWTLSEREMTALVSTSVPPEESAGANRKVRSLIQALDLVVSLLESEDPYFAGSTHRVRELAEEVATRMKLTPDTVDEILVASLLRDIGKLALGASLLENSEVFDEAAARKMQDHVAWAERLLDHIDFPWRIRLIVRHHHERYDGKGYPDGIAGRAIPIGARIVAAADAFVAMVSDRRHRPAKPLDEARNELMTVAGKQLDPEVVEVLLAAVSETMACGSAGTRPTVVLADFDTAYRRLLRLRLQDEGIEVVMRDTLVEVGPIVRGNPPGLIAADLGGEGVSGLARLREDASSGERRVPIVILAPTDDRTLRLACLKHGIDDFIAKDRDLEETVARIKNVLLRSSDRPLTIAAEGNDGIRGRLEEMSLPDVVQFLSLGAKTAHVAVGDDEGPKGELWVEGGSLVHAAAGDARGEAALFEMLRWDSGQFRIHHGVTTADRSLEGDPMHLLLEGLRLRDEAAAVQEAS